MLPPEFSRAERFDGVFFLDLPSAAEKEKIWPIHLDRHGLSSNGEKRPADENWTGAEIASCCRLSALLYLPLVEAAKNVVPVAVTAAESVEKLRTWAAGRCLDASRPRHLPATSRGAHAYGAAGGAGIGQLSTATARCCLVCLGRHLRHGDGTMARNLRRYTACRFHAEPSS